MGALRSALLLRTGLRARPAEAGRVRAPHCLVNGGGITRGTQRRRQPILHSLGTSCGKLPNSGSGQGESFVSNGEAHRWKAPRVQQNASLFAERRGKRPWRRWQVAKAASFSGGLASSSGRPDEPRELFVWTGGAFVARGNSRAGVWWASRKQVRPVSSSWAHASTCVPCGVGLSSRHSRRASRRQVSEPIGSGRSFRCEQSRRKAPGRAKAARPLTRETSAGSLRSCGLSRASAAIRGDEGEPLDTVSRRRPAAAGWVLQACASGRRVLGRGGRSTSSNVCSRMRTS